MPWLLLICTSVRLSHEYFFCIFLRNYKSAISEIGIKLHVCNLYSFMCVQNTYVRDIYRVQKFTIHLVLKRVINTTYILDKNTILICKPVVKIYEFCQTYFDCWNQFYVWQRNSDCWYLFYVWLIQTARRHVFVFFNYFCL